MSDYQNTPPPAPTGSPNAEERQWGMFAHLASLSGVIIPFGTLLGPLIVWLVKKDTMPFVSDQGKEALNFNITVFIALVVSGILTLVLIGLLLLAVVCMAGADHPGCDCCQQG